MAKHGLLQSFVDFTSENSQLLAECDRPVGVISRECILDFVCDPRHADDITLQFAFIKLSRRFLSHGTS